MKSTEIVGSSTEALEAVRGRHGLPDLHAGESREGDDLARPRLLQLDPLQPLEAKELEHPGLLVRAVAHRPGFAQRQERHRLPDPDTAPLDPPDRDPAQVRGVVQRRHEHLEPPGRVSPGWRDRLEDRLE